jgi:phosphatidate cytidylyltransferase
MEILKRILVAVIFIPVLLLIFYLGGWYLKILLALILTAQLVELRHIFAKLEAQPNFLIVPLGLLFYFANILASNQITIAVLVASIIIMMSIDLFSHQLQGAVKRISFSIFALIYLSLFLALTFKLSLLGDDKYLLLGLMVTIWVTDSAAYFLGMSFGKHRNIFAASPQKSIEGFISGIIAAFITAFLLGMLFGYTNVQIIAMAVAAGIFGQFGDLFESILKRDAGVKDSSNLLPGHGGILDRFDSLLFAAPVLYLLLSLLK